MKRIEYYELMTGLFCFKTIEDKLGNEYVLFAQSRVDSVENITDRTEFEALENHIHLIDNVKKDEFERLIPVAKTLGGTLLTCLKAQYPEKNFVVYVSLHLRDSMIIRFHQKWENEVPYYNPANFQSEGEKVFAFEA